MKKSLNSLGIIITLLLLLFAPSPTQAQKFPPDSQQVRLVNRLSFGLTPGYSQSFPVYLTSQLNPQDIPYPSSLVEQLRKFPSITMTPVEIYQRYEPKSDAEKPAASENKKKILQQAINAHLLRAYASPRQLEELMVDFWFSHFNVYHDKGALIRMWIGSYEQVAIRPYALGRFRDMLEATARHPAMLVYLDNWLNTAPGSPGSRGKYKGINENYARELMELHTLGVDGGYTQQDVIALAKILTGWGLDAKGEKGSKDGFYFYENRHDKSDKVFLGQTIKGGGQEEGEKALDILARHPATARHVSYKLAQYFVADDPPSQLVEKLAKKFSQSEGDIKAVLEVLFNSAEFGDSKYQKFKTPYHYVISLVRAGGVKSPDLVIMADMLKQLGMSVYGCLTPDGYKNTQDAWLSPDAMIRRVSIATDIAKGRLNGEPVDPVLLAKTLEKSLKGKTKEVVKQHPPYLQAALMLGSPEMMYR